MTPEAFQRREARTPVLVVTALAWTSLGLVHLLWTPATHAGGDMAGSAMSPAMHDHAMTPVSWGEATGSWPVTITLSVLMTVAMMSPLLVPALRHVTTRSLPRRRRRAAFLLSAAHAATWVAGSLVLLGVSIALVEGLGRAWSIAAVLAVALAWQWSPAKQQCLNRHHAHPPLAAFGHQADRDVLRFGTQHALWCLGSCWALMLLPLLAGTWHLTVMLLVSVWMWAELLDRPAAATWRVRWPVKAWRIAAHAARSPAPQPR